MDNKTVALNILDVNRRINELHSELETLHEMREELIEQLGSSKK